MHPAAALRRTLTVIITPVTFTSGAAAPGEGLGQSPAPKAPYTFLAFLDVRIAPAGRPSASAFGALRHCPGPAGAFGAVKINS